MLRNLGHQEYQYLSLVGKVIKYGIREKSRNGYTKTLIGESMRYSLINNQIPLLTTKKLAWRSCLKELMWFISGDTHNDTLLQNNVKIWNDNASREFLDSRGLTHYEEGDLGPIYGYQWRNFNMPYKSYKSYQNMQKCRGYFNSDKYKQHDQLSNIINSLKNDRQSRRIIMTAWNPLQLNDMALPPCHILTQFNVLNNKLYCSLYQRSGDIGLGIPFNIASYSFLTILLAKHCGLEPGEFIHHIGNLHMYEEHEDALSKQILKIPKPFPTCHIKKLKKSIDDYTYKDFIVENYQHHPVIKMKMIA